MQNKHQEADNYEAEIQRRASEYDEKTRNGADVYAEQVRDNLNEQVQVIEGNIQGLKQFESAYRARLTEFLNGLMTQVSDTNSYNQTTHSDQ